MVGPRVAAGTSRAWCSLGRAVFSLGSAPASPGSCFPASFPACARLERALPGAGMMQELVAGVEKIRFDSEADMEQQRGARPLPFPGVDSKLGTGLRELLGFFSCCPPTAPGWFLSWLRALPPQGCSRQSCRGGCQGPQCPRGASTGGGSSVPRGAGGQWGQAGCDRAVPGVQGHPRHGGAKPAVCKHWLRGLCKRGDGCDFLHDYDAARMPECYFYSKFGGCGAGHPTEPLPTPPRASRVPRAWPRASG